MSLHHGWGCQLPQTASCIFIRHIQSVWSHWYAVHSQEVAALHSYQPYLAQIWGLWVTCGVKMMSLHHGCGWQPPQTASRIHFNHIHTVWAHWYAVHRHTVACSVRCTHCSDYKARGASGNYKARGVSGNYKARGASGDYEARGASGRKYKAWMVIFCILAAVNRFSRISWIEESRWEKSESRWGK